MGSLPEATYLLGGRILYEYFASRGLIGMRATCMTCSERAEDDTALRLELEGPLDTKPGLDMSDAYLASLDHEQLVAQLAEQNAYLRQFLPRLRAADAFLEDHRCWVPSEDTARLNAQVALDRACMFLARTREGRRNNQLNRVAYIEGRAAIAVGLDRWSVEEAIFEAGIEAGLGEAEARATIRSGLGA